MNTVKWIFAAILLMAGHSIYAAQSNFQVSPPPIPRPDFTDGKKDARFTGSYINIDISGVGDLTGIGLLGAFRQAKKEKWATDFGLGLIILGGDLNFGGANKSDFTMMQIPIQIDVEHMFFKNEKFSILGFLGFDMSLIFGSIKTQYTVLGRTNTTTSSIFGTQYGIPLGVQGGIYFKQFTIAPFISFKRGLGGTFTTSSSSGGSTSTSIKGYSQITFGADFILNKYDISIGTLLQQMAASGGNGQVKTMLIQLSWNKDLAATN